MTNGLYELMQHFDEESKEKEKKQWAINCENHIKENPEW